MEIFMVPRYVWAPQFIYLTQLVGTLWAGLVYSPAQWAFYYLEMKNINVFPYDYFLEIINIMLDCKSKSILLRFGQDVGGWAPWSTHRDRATWSTRELREKFFLYDNWQICPYYICNPFMFKVFFLRSTTVFQRGFFSKASSL